MLFSRYVYPVYPEHVVHVMLAFMSLVNSNCHCRLIITEYTV